MRKHYIILIALLTASLMVGASAYGQADAQISRLLIQAQNASAVEANRILRQLQDYPYSVYTREHKNRLVTLLYSQPRQMDDWFKLAGFLRMQEELQLMPDSLYNSKSVKQAYRLALVRAGDPSKLRNLLRNVIKIPINDNFIYQVAPLLIYTRQKGSIDYLLDIIMESPVSCRPADEETRGSISCAYRLMEMLAPAIVDYPFKIAVSGDLEVDDYQGALQDMQSWISANKDSYQIDQENY